MPFYNNSTEDYLVCIGNELKNSSNQKLYDVSGNRLDSLNIVVTLLLTINQAL